MEKKEIYFERLEILAAHLDTGKLFREYIPMTLTGKELPIFEIEGESYVAVFRFVLTEMTYLFPDELEMTERGLHIIGTEIFEPISTAIFYGLEYLESFHLLSPMAQSPDKFGGKRLPFDAEPKDIAANIYEFIRIMRAGG